MKGAVQLLFSAAPSLVSHLVYWQVFTLPVWQKSENLILAADWVLCLIRSHLTCIQAWMTSSLNSHHTVMHTLVEISNTSDKHASTSSGRRKLAQLLRCSWKWFYRSSLITNLIYPHTVFVLMSVPFSCVHAWMTSVYNWRWCFLIWSVHCSPGCLWVGTACSD